MIRLWGHILWMFPLWITLAFSLCVSAPILSLQTEAGSYLSIYIKKRPDFFRLITCEGAVHVHQLHLVLPPEAGLIG